MKLFPTLSGDKETIIVEKASCTLLTRFSSTLFDRKTEISTLLKHHPPAQHIFSLVVLHILDRE